MQINPVKILIWWVQLRHSFVELKIEENKNVYIINSITLCLTESHANDRYKHIKTEQTKCAS